MVNGEISFMTHDLSKLAVLVVDDNGNMRKVVRTLLATMGIKGVMEAETATGAILEMHQHDIDVVITDLSMQPMNGIDLVRMVRMGRDSPNPHVPIIMLTGHTELELVHEARDVGIDEFVPKPVSVRGLYERLVSIAIHPRPIVMSQRYVGPDRRAQRKKDHAGRERRRAALRWRPGTSWPDTSTPGNHWIQRRTRDTARTACVRLETLRVRSTAAT